MCVLNSAAIENVHKRKINVLLPKYFHLKEWSIVKEKGVSDA